MDRILRDRVLAAMGETIRAVAARFSVSPSYVSKVRARLRETGEATPGPQHNHVRPRLEPYYDVLRARIMSPILAGKTAEGAETVRTRGGRYVSFAVVVAQSMTRCLKPQVAVERDRRLSSEALELAPQRTLGYTGSGGDFGGSERSGEVALHEAD